MAQNPINVAVVGGSGSGKTWLAHQLATLLSPHVARLSLDDFYRDLSHLNPADREAVNFDDPSAIDWESAQAVAAALARGEAPWLPVYDFATHTRQRACQLFRPQPLILWDGLWLLHDVALRERFAFSVFIDCDTQERLARRLQRDVLERGRTETSVRRQFAEQVQPMHERFVEPQKTLATRCINSPVEPSVFAGIVLAIRQCVGGQKLA